MSRGWLALMLALCGCQQLLELPDRRAVPNLICEQGKCSCALGFGDCDQSSASGCETALRDDPDHCGVCGHDCLGGDCLDGHCQPVVMASGLTFADQYPRVVLNAEQLYVLTAAGIVRVPIHALHAEPELLVTTAVGLRDFATDAGDLVWVDNDRVCRGPAVAGTSCAQEIKLLARRPIRVALDAGEVFFSVIGLVPGVSPTICRGDFATPASCLDADALGLTAASRVQPVGDQLFWLGTNSAASATTTVQRTDRALTSTVSGAFGVEPTTSLYGQSPDEVLVTLPGASLVESRLVALDPQTLDVSEQLAEGRLLSGYVRDGEITAYTTLAGALLLAGNEEPLLARDTSYAGLVADAEAFYLLDIANGELLRLRRP